MSEGQGSSSWEHSFNGDAEAEAEEEGSVSRSQRTGTSKSSRASVSSSGSVRTSVDVLVEAERLSEKVYVKLAPSPKEKLAMSVHQSGVSYMVRLRDMLTDLTEAATTKTRMALMCTGVELYRRSTLGVDDKQTLGHVLSTIPLVFMLVVLSEGPVNQEARDMHEHEMQKKRECHDELKRKREQASRSSDADSEGSGPPQKQAKQQSRKTNQYESGSSDGSDAGSDVLPAIASEERKLISKWNAQSLHQQMQAVEDCQAESGASWSRVLQLTPADVSRAALSEARHSGAEWTWDDLHTMAMDFFSCSAVTMQHQLLGTVSENMRGQREGFLTLDTVGLLKVANAQRAERLAAVADAAESEAGQQALRDLVLSFTLPRGVVGTRRTVVMTRDANTKAQQHHPVVVNEAHECAMRGATWSWTKDSNKVHQTCALLAGLAIILCSKTQDAHRKEDAFKGRVQLPFFETCTPKPNTKRLSLIPSRNEWIVYTVNSSQKPTVQFRQTGLEGLSQAILLFIASEKGFQ